MRFFNTLKRFMSIHKQGNPFALVFAIVMIAVTILYKSPILGAISLVLTVLNLLIVGYMIVPLHEKEKKTKEITGKAAQNIVDSLSGAMVSRIFGLKSTHENLKRAAWNQTALCCLVFGRLQKLQGILVCNQRHIRMQL